MTEQESEALDQMFENIIESSKAELLEEKHLQQVAFIAVRIPEDEKIQMLVIPGTWTNQHEKEFYALSVTKLAHGINAEPGKEVLGVIMCLDASMKILEKDEYERGDFIRPLDDPKSTECLIFSLEKEDYSRTIIYQYIRSSENNIVIETTPKHDTAAPVENEKDRPRFEGMFHNLFCKK